MKISYANFLNEFNKQDKDFITSLSDYFTISIEYELVSDYEIDDEPFLETEEDLEKACGYAKDQTLLDMSRGKFGFMFDEKFKLTRETLIDNENKMKEENDISKLTDKQIFNLHKKYLTWTYVNNLMDDIISGIDVLDDENDYTKYINKYEKKLKDEMTGYIITTLDKNIMRFVFEQNMDFLRKKMVEYLPDFTKKWGNSFKYELEGDLDKKRILEFSSKSFLTGLNQCFEQIDDFYNEFDKQTFWGMDNERTALHINIGMNKSKIKWNPLKGLVLMSDMNRERKTPFVFNNILWRINNRFCNSLLDGIMRNISGEIENDYKTKDKVILWNLGFRHKDRLDKHKEYLQRNIDKLDLHNIRELEEFFNHFMIKANKDFYIKEFGIKLTELEHDPKYVEFRYVGGVISKELLKSKLLYFCYIVYLMTDTEYKKKEYHKRVYKFIDRLKSYLY